MTAAAVICEYDPFHRGHRLQIEAIRARYGEDCTVVSLMSGDVVQRGRPAIFPKAIRAEAALRGGADLVLELPAPWSCGSAPHFAAGAVSILSRLGGIDVLCFGITGGDEKALSEAAALMNTDAFRDAMKAAPRGESHMRTAEAVFRSLGGGFFPTEPNDILGTEYLAALRRSGAPIVPFCIRREPGYSAAAARRAILTGGETEAMLPPEAEALYRAIAPTTGPEGVARYDAAALFAIRNTPAETLAGYAYLNGGVAGLLKRKAEETGTVAGLVEAGTGRSYAAARLHRAILSALLKIPKESPETEPVFTRVLAENGKGRRYLASIRKQTPLAIVTKPADGLKLPGEAGRQFEAALSAERLIALLRGEAPADLLRRGPIVAE